MLFNPPPFDILLSRAIVLVIAFSIHEFAHAWTADYFGDMTPRQQGRLTLNPLKHLDPIGSLALLVVGFGWARPVMVNPMVLAQAAPSAFMWVALAGPLSNLALAVVGALPFWFGLQPTLTGGDLFPSLGLLATYLVELESEPVPGAATQFLEGTWHDTLFNSLGAAFPRWRGVSHADWWRGDWRFSYAFEYIGAYEEFGVANSLEAYRRDIGSRMYHDLEAEWRASWGLSAVAGISNLTDEIPPTIYQSGNANTDSAIYRLLGRTYYLRLGWRFE